MAHSKRKRNSTGTKPNKRSRYIDSSASEPSNGSDTLWAAECILDEKAIHGGRRYYIQWKGIDPDTGKAWEPTWEPEENANDVLVAHWEQQKARDLEEGRQISRGSSRGQSAQPHDAQEQRRICNSRVVDSSPEPTGRPSTPSTPLNQRRRREASGSATASPARPSPRIQIARRGDSLERDEYALFSQIASPGPGSTQSHAQDTDLDSSQLFTARPRPLSSGVVPDSQSSVGEGTFVSITQRTDDTSQQSTDTNESHIEEEVVEDSSLLELIEEAAQHAVSPARSIPETVPDTTAADSQSQRQRLEAESRGAPQALEFVHISSQVDQASSQELEDSAPIQHGEDAQGVARVEHPLEDTNELETRQSDHLVSQATSAQAARETTSDGDNSTQSEHPRLNPAFEDVAGGASAGVVDIAEIPPSLNKSFTLVDNSQSHPPERSNVASETQVVVNSTHEASQHQIPQQINVGDSQPSLIEHSLLEDNDQFPFQSQHPFVPSQPLQSLLIAIPEQLEHTSATPVSHSEQVLAGVSAPSLTFPTPAPDPPHQSLQASPFHHQVRDDAPVRSPEPESALNLGISASDQPQVADTIYAQLLHASSSPEREQNAQVLPFEADLSTQDDTAKSIWPTIEKEPVHRASSESRHDSSQETPERPSRSLNHETSPVPYPPSYSLKTQGSRLPPRPSTPISTSSLSIMSGESTSDKVRRQMQEILARSTAVKPPKAHLSRSSTTTPVKGNEPAATPTPLSRLRTNEPPEGTRSPSAVPDRSPIAQTPTSLRNIAYATSNVPLEVLPLDKVMASPPNAAPEPAVAEGSILSETIAPVLTSPASEEMDVSDADDEDSDSLLNDDLQLADQEFIVPLFIQGRQCDTYGQYILSNKDLLERFLKDPRNVSPIEEVEKILSQLQAIETHMDLVFAEAENEDLNGEDFLKQAEHAARFGMENSTKFRFLARLFQELRNSKPPKHIILLTERDGETLYRIIQTFCEANFIRYTMPSKDWKTNRKEPEGSLLVTVIPSDASPVIRPPDLIICLDGVQDAAQIRKKNWAKSSDRDVVPVIHLVIPRTVGHLERYVASGLDPVERVHTILASLAHFRPDIGKAIDDRTPRDVECASEVANWIENIADGAEWPLPSIGSVKEVIEYQTQLSQYSTGTPVPERTKRPLDEEDLDPAKRMRFTPQPQRASAVEKEHEITHISDSMPGTAAHELNLQRRSAPVDESVREEQEAHRAEQKHFRESEAMWEKQQGKHEDLARDYRIQKGKLQTAEGRVETLTKNNATLTERLATRTMEMRELEERLQEQRKTDSLSTDAQTAEITKLRQELAKAREEKDKAMKNASRAEGLLEYTRSSFQDAQNAASINAARVKELEEEVKRLSSAASGEATKRKGMHLDQNYDRQQKKIASLEGQLGICKRMLQSKDEEILRLKSVGRPGVGTRGTSATPQPKTRSRAGSPSFMGGRVSNLRNG
ncbi:hypothetical protein G6011_03518 [Alternaria panax]|uniref:Chromo domain-containing protein n=1 Tax=Alternaria panax TaxID=48097 RepID=A0AAD4IFG9_9PLEO|nr:hypothetical protein G6011_03518 [Alternaria panax]